MLKADFRLCVCIGNFPRRWTAGWWRPIRHRGGSAIAKRQQPNFVTQLVDWHRWSGGSWSGFTFVDRRLRGRDAIPQFRVLWQTTKTQIAIQPTGSTGRRFRRSILAGRGRRPTRSDGSHTFVQICWQRITAPICWFRTTLIKINSKKLNSFSYHFLSILSRMCANIVSITLLIFIASNFSCYCVSTRLPSRVSNQKSSTGFSTFFWKPIISCVILFLFWIYNLLL